MTNTKLTLIAPLFMASIVFADDYKSLVTSPPSAAQINSCIVQMCGPAALNTSAYTAATKSLALTKDNIRLWTAHLAPDVTSFVTADTALKRAYITRLDGVIQQGQLAPNAASSPTKALAVAGNIVKTYFTPNMNQLMELNKSSLRALIKENSAREIIAKISDPATQNAALHLWEQYYRPLLEFGFTQIKPQSDQYALANRLADRLSERYPGVAADQALKRDAQKVQDQVDAFQRTYGVLASELYTSNLRLTRGLLRQALAGKDLDKVDSEAYVLAADAIEINFALTNPDLMQSLMAVSYDTTKELQTAKAVGLADKLMQLFGPEATQKRIADLQSQCSLHSLMAMGLSPVTADYERAKAQMERARQAARSVVPAIAHGQNTDELLARINQTQFLLPDGSLDNFKRLRRDLSGGALEAMALIRRLSDKIQIPDADVFYLVTQFALQELSDTDPVASECGRLPSGGVGDATLTAQGRVFLSWFTLRFPQYSLSILAHEFGHAMSLYLRKAPQFSTVLSCIANRNPYVVSPVNLDLDYVHDTQWTEEDWADYYSSLILNELKDKEPNMGCALLKQDDKNYTENTFAPTEGDPHSAGLFRLMTIAQDRGQKIPDCAPLMSYAPANHRELSCH